MKISDIPIQKVIALAKQAGNTALAIARDPDRFKIEIKPDDSPVTTSDIEANRIVCEGLARLTPNTPILSEEQKDKFPYKQFAINPRSFWCADPIDGTKTMIGHVEGKPGHDGFAVKIGLSNSRGVPVLGVVFYPATNTVFYTDAGVAYKQVGDNPPEPLQAKKGFANPLKVTVSYRPEDQPESIAGKTITKIPEVGGGRILKVAERKADIAWLNFPAAPWDLLADTAIARASKVKTLDVKSGLPVRFIEGNESGEYKPAISIPASVAGHLGNLFRLGFAENELHSLYNIDTGSHKKIQARLNRFLNQNVTLNVFYPDTVVYDYTGTLTKSGKNYFIGEQKINLETLVYPNESTIKINQ